ncbi:MAG: hypothetical protein LBR79_06915 [Oscillospiraceae bacterium]|jgi:hypothetical protein|nr:hypothetical protein [Oscillospiraceae bacterium]
MKRSSIKKTFLWVIFILIFFYSLHIIYKKIYINVSTETITQVTIDDVVDCKSIIIRNEDIISSENQIFLKYFVDNGERISKGDIVAKCFDSQEEAMYSAELSDIKNELETIQKVSLNDNFGRDLSSISKDINNEIRNIFLKCEYLDIYKNRKKITNLLNERQNALGNGNIFSKRVEYLKSRKSELEKMINSQTPNIYSPYAGYFVSKTDGYEKTVNYEDIKKFDYNDMIYENIIKNKADEKNAIGKIIKSTKWYVLCYVSAGEICNIQEGMEVSAKFACENDYIPAKVERIVKNEDENDSLVILSCEYMNNRLCFTRLENISVKKTSYSGFKIPKEALRFYEDSGAAYKGIYVKNGANLIFKKINILYSENNFIVAETFKNSGGNDEKPLANGDLVVVNGKNLYDGKCVL